MIHPGSDQIDLNTILQVIWRKKWFIVISVITVIIPVIFYNETIAPEYESRTAFVYENYPDIIEGNRSQRSPEVNVITNTIEEIKSFSFAEEVYELLPPEVTNSIPKPPEVPAGSNLRAYVCERIQKSIQVDKIISSDVIEVTTKGRDPHTAMELAKAVMTVLEQRNIRQRQQSISNARQLIENHLTNYEELLKSSEESLKGYKEQGIVTSIDDESREILKRITDTEVKYNDARANRDASEKRLTYLRNEISKKRRELLPAATQLTSPMITRLKEELVELEIQYTKIKVQDYDENHPAMRELKSQIEKTSQKLFDETLKLVNNEKIIDPLSQLQRLIEESINVEIEVQSYRAQETALEQIIKKYQSDLYSMPEKELTLVRLIRDRDVNNKIYMMLVEKLEEVRIQEAQQQGNIRVFEPPKISDKPVWPRKNINLIIALFTGTILGLGWITLHTYLDNSIHTPEQLKQVSGLKVVGTIPKFKKNGLNHGFIRPGGMLKRKNVTGNGENLISKYKPVSLEVEAFRHLRTNLQHGGFGNSVRTILVTSCVPGVGKSFVTANLAIASANIGVKTLIVDADFRKPKQHMLFGCERNPGLSDLILAGQTAAAVQPGDIPGGPGIQTGTMIDTSTGSTSFENDARILLDYINSNRLIHPTSTDGLDLLTAGTIQSNPSDNLAMPNMAQIASLLKELYQVILFDSPPANVIADASILCPLVDGVLLVVKSGIDTDKDIQQAAELLNQTSRHVLGIVDNYIDTGFKYKSYYSHKYHT